MNFRILNIAAMFMVIWAGSAFFAAGSSVMAQAASPEAVIKAFYNGYVQAMNSGVDPLGKNSALKKYFAARFTMQKIKAFETKNQADYFFQSQEYSEDWENKFTISKPAVKGSTATSIVTFPGGYPRVKVVLQQEAGIWKIAGVANAQK
jgi:hypothetical protein